MPHIDIVREIDTPQSFRVSAVSSMFDVSLQQKTRQEWHIDLPLDEKLWQIGLIIGPSGCGKSTIAQELWPKEYIRKYEWNEQSVLDNFAQGLDNKQIIGAMTSVGFSSPPDWVKPYHILSTGQQMRCDLARAICHDGLVVFDEFTSVVDRTVAKIGSAALANAIRKQPERQFIAITCHEDVLEWLLPDWTYEPATNIFQWRCLRRPSIELKITRVHSSAWQLFKNYHYLSANLHKGSQCYIATWNDNPVAFCSALHLAGFTNMMMGHRTVVLPDYQGIGIGSRLSDTIGQIYLDQGKRYRSVSSHPAFIHYRNKSAKWKLCSQSTIGNKANKMRAYGGLTHSAGRAVVTFEYIGETAKN